MLSNLLSSEMVPKRLFPMLIPPCLLCISLILIQIPASHGANNAQYANCSATIRCGSVQNVSYPFWGINRADYCGLSSEFQLACVDNTSLQISIKGLTHRVLQVDNSSRLFTVARADYNGTICPQYLHNSSQDVTPFSYYSDTAASNLTLYYGCPSPSSEIMQILKSYNLTSAFTCNVNDSSSTGYFLTRSVEDIPAAGISSFYGSCETSVVVPANLSAIRTIEDSPTEANVEAALEAGFGLQWENDDGLCQSCIRSGGQCGRKATSSAEFACHCSDKSYSSTCGENKNQMTIGLGLGLAGAGLTGLLLGFWIFSIRTKKKKRREAAAAASAASASLSQSKDISTLPSSKGILPISTTSYSRTTPSYPSTKSDLEKCSTYFGVQVFSYMDLEEATHNFDPARELGEGGFGTVYYGELLDGRVVAVKRLFENNMKRVEQFMNEVEILALLRHNNLVTLYGCTSRRSRELLLVYEYVPNGTVADHLHGKRASSGLVPWRVRLNIAIETADALAYLHESDVIHRDVKTNNILLDNNFRVKVADFGLSRLFPSDVTHVSTAPQGTPGYVDPEYYQCYQLTDKSDVYSFGVVLCELISSKPAVDTNRHRHDINLANMAVNKIQNHTLQELVDPSLGFETDYSVRRMATLVAELAFRCLQQERDMRPTMLEVLEALRRIKNEENSFQSTAEAVEMDIHFQSQSDDAGLLKNNVIPPPLSPDSSVTDKWVGNFTAPNSF